MGVGQSFLAEVPTVILSGAKDLAHRQILRSAQNDSRRVEPT
jgi:hypothetical protein